MSPLLNLYTGIVFLFLLEKIIPKIPDLQKETLSVSSSIQFLDFTLKLTLLSIDKTFINPR